LFAAALLAAALSCPAQAQTAVSGDTTHLYQHQLGLTVSPQFGNLFTRNQVLPLGLLYKHQVRLGQAWRVRLTGYYSRHDTATAGGANYLQEANKGPDARVWEVNGFVGYEWQHRLGRHWQWAYGLEVGGGYWNEYRAFSNHYYDQIGFNGGGPYTTTEAGSRYLHRWQVQGRGFAGLSYNLSSQVRLFIETALALSYRHRTIGGSYTSSIDNPNYGISPGGIYPDDSVNLFSAEYQPVQVLGLSVCF
jgi:hypothetical protein